MSDGKSATGNFMSQKFSRLQETPRGTFQQDGVHRFLRAEEEQADGGAQELCEGPEGLFFFFTLCSSSFYATLMYPLDMIAVTPSSIVFFYNSTTVERFIPYTVCLLFQAQSENGTKKSADTKAHAVSAVYSPFSAHALFK